MKLRLAVPLVLLFATILLATAAMATTVYLEADFNDKTIDQPIGTGGAAVGEPVEVDGSIAASVRIGPEGSPSLEIQDNSETTAGYTYFEFLESAEVTTGMVGIEADLWFHSLTEGYQFGLLVREQGGAACSFATMRFNADGSITLTDAAGSAGEIGSYVIDTRVRVVLEFNMDAGTYDVLLDGVLVINDREHSVTGSGIGSVLFGCDYDTDTAGYFNIDAIRVSDDYQSIATEEHSWGRMKSRFAR